MKRAFSSRIYSRLAAAAVVLLLAATLSGYIPGDALGTSEVLLDSMTIELTQFNGTHCETVTGGSQRYFVTSLDGSQREVRTNTCGDVRVERTFTVTPSAVYNRWGYPDYVTVRLHLSLQRWRNGAWSEVHSYASTTNFNVPDSTEDDTWVNWSGRHAWLTYGSGYARVNYRVRIREISP